MTESETYIGRLVGINSNDGGSEVIVEDADNPDKNRVFPVCESADHLKPCFIPDANVKVNLGGDGSVKSLIIQSDKVMHFLTFGQPDDEVHQSLK